MKNKQNKPNTPDTPEQIQEIDLKKYQNIIDTYCKNASVTIIINNHFNGLARTDVSDLKKPSLEINLKMMMEHFKLTADEVLFLVFHEVEHLNETAALRNSSKGEAIEKKKEKKFQEWGKYASTYHNLENVIRDAFVNNEVVSVRKAPVLYNTRQELFENKTHAELDMRGLPKHLQLLHALNKECVTSNGQRIVDPDVRKILNNLMKKWWLTWKAPIDEAINGKYLKWWKFDSNLWWRLTYMWEKIEPIYKKLFDEDMKNAKDNKNNEGNNQWNDNNNNNQSNQNDDSWNSQNNTKKNSKENNQKQDKVDDIIKKLKEEYKKRQQEAKEKKERDKETKEGDQETEKKKRKETDNENEADEKEEREAKEGEKADKEKKKEGEKKWEEGKEEWKEEGKEEKKESDKESDQQSEQQSDQQSESQPQEDAQAGAPNKEKRDVDWNRENPFEPYYERNEQELQEILKNSLTQEQIDELVEKAAEFSKENEKEEAKSEEEVQLEQRVENMGVSKNSYNFDEIKKRLKEYDTYMTHLEQMRDTETWQNAIEMIMEIFQKIKSNRGKSKTKQVWPVDIEKWERLHGPRIADGIAEIMSGEYNPEMFQKDIKVEYNEKESIGEFDVTIVCDGSWSMSGTKNREQKKAALLIFESLKRLYDKILRESSITREQKIVFNTDGKIFNWSENTKTLKKSSPDFSDQERIHMASLLDYDNGGTDDYYALEETYNEIVSKGPAYLERIKKWEIKRIILVTTDGASSDENRLVNAIKKLKKIWVLIYGIGVGGEYKDVIKNYTTWDDKILWYGVPCPVAENLPSTLLNILKPHLENL